MGLLLLYGVSALSVWGALMLALFTVRRAVKKYIAENGDACASDEFLGVIVSRFMGKGADFACLGIALLSPLVIVAGLFFLLWFLRPVLKVLSGVETSPMNTGEA